MHDASTIARPVFFRSRTTGFLPIDALYQVVRQVVSQDSKSASSAVGRMLKRAGGPILDARFK
jgi:hypothetical protein